METSVRLELARIVAAQGESVAADPARLNSLLLDHCRNRHREHIAVLVEGARLGVVEKLRTAPAADLGAVVKALAHSSTLSPAAIAWCVDAWGGALGLLPESDLIVEWTCPHCGAGAEIERARAVANVECVRCGSGHHRAPAPEVADASTPPAPGPVAAPPRPAAPPPYRPPTGAQTAGPVAPPPTRWPAVVVVLAASAGGAWWLASKKPVPEPPVVVAQPVAAPAPVVEVTRWTIAALRARTYPSASGRAGPSEVRRGDVVEVLEESEGRARVRSVSGAMFWIDPKVAIPHREAERLAGLECDTYTQRSEGDFVRRWLALGLEAQAAQLSFGSLLEMVRTRHPDLDEKLRTSAKARPSAEGGDTTAATWYRWDVRYAQAMAREAGEPTEVQRWTAIAMRCARASTYADPSDPEGLFGWALAAHRNGEAVPRRMLWAPYLAHDQSTAWAVFALALADDPSMRDDGDLLGGAVVKLLQHTRERATSLVFLRDLQPRVSAPLQAAIDRAIAETDPARPALAAQPTTPPTAQAPMPAAPVPIPVPVPAAQPPSPPPAAQAPAPAPPTAPWVLPQRTIPPAPLPPTQDARLHALLTEGEAALSRGAFSEARALAREALQRSPGDPRARSLAERARKAEVDALGGIFVQ